MPRNNTINEYIKAATKQGIQGLDDLGDDKKATYRELKRLGLPVGAQKILKITDFLHNPQQTFDELGIESSQYYVRITSSNNSPPPPQLVYRC